MEYLSLSGDLTRANAVEKVLTVSTSDDAASEICLDAGPVERIDAVAAAALRLRMARHHRDAPSGNGHTRAAERGRNGGTALGTTRPAT